MNFIVRFAYRVLVRVPIFLDVVGVHFVHLWKLEI